MSDEKAVNTYDTSDMIRREAAIIAGPLKIAAYRVRDPATGEFSPLQFHSTFNGTVLAVMGEHSARAFAQFVSRTLRENSMDALQAEAVAVGREVFGDRNMDDPRERALRFGEEAMELCRSAGLSWNDVSKLAEHEFLSKDQAGELSQETAGVQNTLFGLASAHKITVSAVTETEIQRVLSKKAECRAKHDAKPSHLVAEKVTAV